MLEEKQAHLSTLTSIKLPMRMIGPGMAVNNGLLCLVLTKRMSEKFITLLVARPEASHHYLGCHSVFKSTVVMRSGACMQLLMQ